jgi:hypothetical protein
MFLRVIQGRVTDADGLRTSLDRWVDRLAAGAGGWLGTTAGVADDGRSITLARYASAGAAQGNNEWQTRWWQEASPLFGDPVAVHDCSQVMEQLAGVPDDAGFVQVLQGRIADLDRMQQLLEDASPQQAEDRPDILGGMLGLHGDGTFTQVVYFSSETDAREGERHEWPAQNVELDPLVLDADYLDLRHPWTYAPR